MEQGKQDGRSRQAEGGGKRLKKAKLKYLEPSESCNKFTGQSNGHYKYVGRHWGQGKVEGKPKEQQKGSKKRFWSVNNFIRAEIKYTEHQWLVGKHVGASGSEGGVKRKPVEAVEGSQRVKKAVMISKKGGNWSKCTILTAVDFCVSKNVNLG